MTPKSLLSRPEAVSLEQEFLEGESFREVMADPQVDETMRDSIERVIFCSGKVYYDLLQYRKEQEIDNAAIIRVEKDGRGEVLADDVKAAHGAASAPIDVNQIHYLASRGLSHEEASALIVEGFLMDAFREIKSEEVVAVMRTRLLVHLECLMNG